MLYIDGYKNKLIKSIAFDYYAKPDSLYTAEPVCVNLFELIVFLAADTVG